MASKAPERFEMNIDSLLDDLASTWGWPINVDDLTQEDFEILLGEKHVGGTMKRVFASLLATDSDQMLFEMLKSIIITHKDYPRRTGVMSSRKRLAQKRFIHRIQQDIAAETRIILIQTEPGVAHEEWIRCCNRETWGQKYSLASRKSQSYFLENMRWVEMYPKPIWVMGTDTAKNLKVPAWIFHQGVQVVCIVEKDRMAEFLDSNPQLRDIHCHKLELIEG